MVDIAVGVLGDGVNCEAIWWLKMNVKNRRVTIRKSTPLDSTTDYFLETSPIFRDSIPTSRNPIMVEHPH